MRFMIGPWTDEEVEHHETIAAVRSRSCYPNVNFLLQAVQLGDVAATEVNTSLAEGAHDIYYFGEGVPPTG